MNTLWRTIVALLLILPVGGYVAGSLMSSGAAEPERRDPIVIDGSPSPTPAPEDRSEGPSVDNDPSGSGEPTVVTPRPEEVEEVDDDRRTEDDRDDREDRSRSGGRDDDEGDDDDERDDD